MNRLAILIAVLAAACATPEVARKYETRSYVPEELAAALGSEDPTIRADAAKQVEAMDPATRKATLLELSRDGRPPVRLMAVSRLGKHHGGEAEVIARLADVLSLDADADVRASAATGLADAGTGDALRALAAALMDDGSLVVKRAAASGLDRATGQTFGAAVATRITDAEAAAEEAAMSYEEWLDERGGGK